jgi:hypothetical protein
MRGMLAVIWHYWVGVVIAVGSIAAVGGLVASYFKSVESARYPKKQ